jgi:tRNA nucleotidyltransferase (CCA-adding enzyme)
MQTTDLLARLGPPVQQTLSSLVQAVGSQARFWLVGGVVRDLLLERDPGRDFDLVFEGMACGELVALLSKTLRVLVIAEHEAFGTATLLVGDPPLLLDLARARVERYAQPAVLPAVEPASLEEDLFRRDFTVNALALALAGDGERLLPAPLIDQYQGLEDLRKGVLRVIHPASFRDDPTRILRGLRLAARLDLRLEATTQQYLAEALAAGYLGLLTAERIQHELCLALEEPAPEEVLRLADAWGVSAQLFTGLHWNEQLARRCVAFRTADRQLPIANRQSAEIHAGLLAYELTNAEREALVVRYRLPGAVANLLRDISRAQGVLPKITNATAPGTLDRLLRPFSEATLAVVYYAEQPPIRTQIAFYVEQLRPQATLLDGVDLQQLGVAPGPLLGQLLAALRAAQLDQAWTSRAEAVAWVQAHIAGESHG